MLCHHGNHDSYTISVSSKKYAHSIASAFKLVAIVCVCVVISSLLDQYKLQFTHIISMGLGSRVSLDCEFVKLDAIVLVPCCKVCVALQPLSSFLTTLIIINDL